MWRGSRHIILVERGRSAAPTIIYGISSGGWRREVTAQTLVGDGLLSHCLHTRSSCVLAECAIARISTELPRARPDLHLRVAFSTALGQAEADRRMAARLQRLHMPSIRHPCCLAHLGGPRLCGSSRRSSLIGCPQLGQLTTRAPSSLAAGAGGVDAAMCWSSSSWLRRRARLRRIPRRNRP